VIRQVSAPHDGYVAKINGEALGWAVVDLGGGRMKQEDPVNPAVGLSDVASLGTQVKRGQGVAVVHAVRSDQADRAAEAVLGAMTLSGSRPKVPEQIIERIG